MLERSKAGGEGDHRGAAALLAKTPGGVQIRTLQTLEKISSEPSQKTVVFLSNDIEKALHKLA